MGRQQIRRKAGHSVQHRSSSRPKSSVRPLSESLIIKLFLKLCQQYSLPLLIAVWVLLGVLATIAAKSILDPNVSIPLVSQPSESPQTEAASTSSTLPGVSLGEVQSSSKSQGNDLPFVALGAIAFTCATGCLMIARTLQPRRATKNLHSPISSQTQSSAEPTIAPFPVPPAQPEANDSPNAVPATVTVLPMEQGHPLDWDEPSLADSLDLRQQHSASSWL